MKKFTQNLRKTTALGLDWYFTPVTGDRAVQFLNITKQIKEETEKEEELKLKCKVICMFLKELKDSEGDLIEMSEKILYENVDISVIDSLYGFLAPVDQKEMMEKMLSNPILMEKLIKSQSSK